MLITILLILIALVAAVWLLFIRKRPAKPTDPTRAEGWEIGPPYNGSGGSKNMPLHPSDHPDGLSIELPHPTAYVGHANYVTFVHGPLTGKKRIRARFRVEADPGVELRGAKPLGEVWPAMLTLYFQRRGDDWTAKPDTEAHRWWATKATVYPVRPGEFVLVVGFDEEWTAVHYSNSLVDKDKFQAALQNAERIGFTLGGGDGYGHGVYATGPARIIIMKFEVE
jgi:hypothetical protein